MKKKYNKYLKTYRSYLRAQQSFAKFRRDCVGYKGLHNFDSEAPQNQQMVNATFIALSSSGIGGRIQKFDDIAGMSTT